MLRIIISIGIIMTVAISAGSAQGCVAIRGNSSCGGSFITSPELLKSEFQITTSYRYFKSFRHFRGSEEEHNRIEDGTEVINKSSFLDLIVNYGLTDRMFISATLPFVFHDRSSMYEHGGNPPNGLGERHTTNSSGISDVRLSMNYWLFRPGAKNYNYSLGLGVKLPTGSYDYMDEFYNQGPDRDQTVVTVVDQSIQPGDGGLGFSLDLQGYHMVGSKFGIGTSLFYLFNVEETNGVLTRNGNSEFSVPDQFGARVVGFYNTNNGFSFIGGGRIEGVPSSDLIGGSAGYRRPGYAVSVEPGVAYTHNALFFNLSVPIAVYRNRVQSFEDKERTASTGVYRHGDAAFADYLINFAISYRFGAKPMMMEDHN